VDPAGRRGAVHIDPLQLEQFDLRFQTSGEAGEPEVGADHTMARDDDRDRIGTHGLTDGACLIGLADVLGELAVRGDVTVRHLTESIVDLLLEVGGHPGIVERQVEVVALPGEVLLELADGIPEVRWPRLRWVGVTLVRERAELDPTDAVDGRPDGDGPDAGVGQVSRVNLDRVQCVASGAPFFNASCKASNPSSAHLMRTGNLLTP